MVMTVSRSITGTVSVGDTVTGLTSTNTGYVCEIVDNSYVILADKSGAFTNGETMQVSAGNSFAITTPATDTTGIIWQGLMAAEEIGEAGLVIAGQTTSATQYMEMTADTDASIFDEERALFYNSSYAAYKDTQGAYVNSVDVNVNFMRISRLQFNNNGQSRKDAIAINGQTSGATIVLDRILCKTAGGTNSSFEKGIHCSDNDAIVQATNIFVWADAGVTSGGGGAYLLEANGSNNGYWRNVLLASPSNVTEGTGAALSIAYQRPTVQNVAIFHHATPVFKNGAPATTVDYAATDQSTIDALNGTTSLTYANQFIEEDATGTLDLRLAVGHGLDVGTDDTANNPNDIFGRAYDSVNPVVGVYQDATGGITNTNLAGTPGRIAGLGGGLVG
jgi:hypothetical protein